MFSITRSTIIWWHNWRCRFMNLKLMGTEDASKNTSWVMEVTWTNHGDLAQGAVDVAWQRSRRWEGRGKLTCNEDLLMWLVKVICWTFLDILKRKSRWWFFFIKVLSRKISFHKVLDPFFTSQCTMSRTTVKSFWDSLFSYKWTIFGVFVE